MIITCRVLFQDQRLRCLEQEFEDCKDFDKRRQIRGDIKELRTRIRGGTFFSGGVFVSSPW